MTSLLIFYTILLLEFIVMIVAKHEITKSHKVVISNIYLNNYYIFNLDI